MKRVLILTAALVAAVAVFTVVSLPPRRLALDVPFDDGTIPGIIHVHTSRSDGRSTPEEVASAAKRAGLRFVVFTDHGDAMRTPDLPAYRSGVLCLDAVEISTTGGHYISLDMPAAPYPLAGDPRGVVEDVKRLGGFGIVAHPNSPKPDLGWRDWNAPFDAIEWLNPDTSWRLRVHEPGWRSRMTIVETLAGYPWRAAESIARALTDTGLGVDRWRSFAHKRRVVLLSGADAHARLDLTAPAPGRRVLSVPFPSYESSFRAMSIHLKIDRPLTGDAPHDATTIVEALRRGHAYTAIDGVASPPAFTFTATNGRTAAGEGDLLEGEAPATLHVRSNAPSSFLTILWRDDERVETVRDQVEIDRPQAEPGIYRVAIVSGADRGSMPWIISNPIYVGVKFPPAGEPAAVVSESKPLFEDTSKWWRTEADPSSLAALDVAQAVGGSELRMRFGLSGGAAAGQYASLAVELPNGAAPYDRVAFTARAERPMRVTVQLQPLGRAEGWQRSIYVDEMKRAYTIRFDEAAPMGSTRTPHPDPARIHDILLVVETTNTKPGAAGRLWISSAALQR